MFLEKNRSRIETGYDKVAAEFPALFGDIRKRMEECSGDVQLALKYLYGTMPLSDIGNYDFDVFLDYALHGVYLYEHCTYVREMPEEIFLNYVLYHRINEEEIAPCRSVFYGDMKDRIHGMAMKEAALEVNYWCAEKATYQCTDERTAAAMTVYRCGHGRCGEESTFTVNAMRSVGIPARQVYAPRWSHCDDNHAWVEVWCSGKWYFIGACEPEEIMNKGWFTNAASRAMLVHSRWFDSILPEEEDVMGKEGSATILNQLERYAATKRVSIQVKDREGIPVGDAFVSLEILNYSEFVPISLLKTDEEGKVSLTTGLGSLHVLARKGNLMGESLLDTREGENFQVTIDEEKPEEGWKDFDIIAPLDTPVNTDQPTEEQKIKNGERLAVAADIRLAKVERFVPRWKTEFVEKAGENRDLCEKLMEVLTVKDRVDADPEVLKDHMEKSMAFADCYPEDIFLSYVMNPRVFDEVLTSYRGVIGAFFSEEEKENFVKNPKEIWNWISSHICEKPERERLSVYTTPGAALKLGAAGEVSKHILFVAIARTLGIPSRLNPVDRAMEYLVPCDGLVGTDAWKKGRFAAVKAEAEKSASLELVEKGSLVWTYTQNWSVSKLEKDGYHPMDLAMIPWKEGHLTVDLEPGDYRILTSNRLPNGNVFGKRCDFTLEKGQHRVITMEFRDAKLSDMLENISIRPFYVLDHEGQRVQAADLTRGKRRILFWLEESKEPTEHILNELMERQEEFTKYQENLLFIIRDSGALSDPTLSKCRKALPDIPVLYDTFRENVNTLGRRMYVDPDKLPLIIVTDGELNGVYATSGYNVGTADMLLRILEM